MDFDLAYLCEIDILKHFLLTRNHAGHLEKIQTNPYY